MKRLQGRVAAITGGANGIGRGCALRLAREGAAVALIDREAGPLGEAASEIEALGARAFVLAGDCTDSEVTVDFVRQAEQALGPIDVLVNNVGQSARELAGPFLASEESTWRFMVEINLMTTMRFCRAIGPGMCARGAGRIVNIASDTALVGDVGYADYAAAKMGVIGFTRGLAREVAGRGVTVNAICPGPIATRALNADSEGVRRSIAMVPVGFLGEPDDIAGMVAMLASDEGRYITGQTLAVNGGRTMA